MGGKSSQEPVPELGAGGAPVRAGTPSGYPSGYPKMARFLLDSVDDFMVYRRFGTLHVRHCLQKQEESMDLEQQLQELDEGDDHDLFQEHYWNSASRTSQAASKTSRAALLKEMDRKLSEYDACISSMMSLRQTPTPSARHYRNVREYLVHGPPIQIDHSEVRGTRWTEYESVVKDLLMEPKIVPWLDGPVDQDWGGNLYQQRGVGKRKEKNDTTWISRQMRRCDNITMGGCVLFWISHVTAALGFILTSNTSEDKGHPMSEILLGYWYLSAVCIFVPEVISKGHLYARKVFLGGVATCTLGFYTLNVLLGISTTSAFTAIPTFFTIVLLLIRTM